MENIKSFRKFVANVRKHQNVKNQKRTRSEVAESVVGRLQQVLFEHDGFDLFYENENLNISVENVLRFRNEFRFSSEKYILIL